MSISLRINQALQNILPVSPGGDDTIITDPEVLNRLNALEEKAHEHENKDLLDNYLIEELNQTDEIILDGGTSF